MNDIILNQESIKALSSDTRIAIMKLLFEKRMTLTELSAKIKLKASTLKAHCEILEVEGIIEKKEEGRKWKYYELTKKGKSILQPSIYTQAKILIVLSIAFFGFAAIIIGIIGSSGLLSYTPSIESSITTENPTQDLMIASQGLQGTAAINSKIIENSPAENAVQENALNLDQSSNTGFNFFNLEQLQNNTLITIAIGFLLLIVATGYLFFRKKEMKV
jgi:DNA-binding transcriptional ArsR family regulator